jgi:hypothetical protein
MANTMSNVAPLIRFQLHLCTAQLGFQKAGGIQVCQLADRLCACAGVENLLVKSSI